MDDRTAATTDRQGEITMHAEPSIAAAATPEQERHALNFAFSELGLLWHWDEDTYARLQPAATDRERLRAYLESQHRHLLTVYDVDFLANAIGQTKQRYYDGALAGTQAQAYA